MIPPVHLAEVRAIEMRINLRCRYVRMAEHFLDGCDVGAAFQKVCGECMPERVRRHVLLNTGRRYLASNDVPGALPR